MFDIRIDRFGLSFINNGISIVVLNIVMVCCMFIISVCLVDKCLLGVIMLDLVVGEVSFQ